ncbi:MAG: imidazoleglycerol-phosphate dehydratase HisB [Clostridiales bacterium]|nr:imidazoleglycerol-phosphate dehydratase HisB [Clostridiales bacterium]
MREAKIKRKTGETDIDLSICLDGGEITIDTGIGFFDHMLTAFAMHGGFGLSVKVKGDLEVDCHHTIEDTGIVLGKAISQALGDKKGITRFGSFYVPMDESLAFAAVDISGRPFLVFDAKFPEERVGGYDSCMTEEFMRALAFHAGLTLHTKAVYGTNSHHMIEALYKAVAHALRLAVTKNQSGQVLSTKGILE